MMVCGADIQCQTYLFGSSEPRQDADNDQGLEWQFLPDSVPPSWPASSEHNIQTLYPVVNKFVSHYNEELWVPEVWEQWDPQSTETISSHLPSVDSFATIDNGRLMSPGSQITTHSASGTSFQTLTQDDYFGRNSACSVQASGQTPSISTPTSSSLMSPLSTSTDMPVRSSRQTKSAPQPQQKSASISMPTRFNSTASKDSRSAARSRRSPRGGSHRVHNNVERQYRARLNDQYSVLLDALPVEITSSHGTDGDKTLSKIEILDLAKQHIATLEEEEAQLKEEKVMLKGQMQLLKGLVQLTGELVP